MAESKLVMAEEAIVVLQQILEQSRIEADDLCKRHLNFVIAENKNKPWEEKSVLYAQARIRVHGLYIVWYTIKWYGKKETGTRRMFKTQLREPKVGYGYNLTVLRSHCQPWEIEMVEEVETALKEIRWRAQRISKALLYSTQLHKHGI